MMIRNSLNILFLITLLGCTNSREEIYHAQGEMAGELTDHSVILQTRLTSSAGLLNGDVPGKIGIARMVLDKDSTFVDPIYTDWQSSDPVLDYILKWTIDTLQPGSGYYYRLEFGTRRKSTSFGPVNSFTTLPGENSEEPVSFVVVTGMNYAKFHFGPHGNPDLSEPGAYAGEDKPLGYPALASILRLSPTFFVGTGDNVYYDHPSGPWAATTEASMRKKWHEQFVQPRFVNLFSKVPVLWEKDDHDYRFNDCDTTGATEPGHDLGKRIFLEQMPVSCNLTNPTSTYRTIRINRHLQVWLVEGRDFRSPNAMPDAPEKSIWGVQQKEWLLSTLLQSDATFKIVISPTPMVGPDDAYKSDNHVNPKGFKTEGDSFFIWLTEHHFPKEQFFIICGDRHWQYHARHPSGYEEFSTGALIDANSRAGRIAGDPKSTDPDGLITQYYVQGSGMASGGFLYIQQKTDNSTQQLIFTMYNEQGEVQYRTIKEPQLTN